MENPPLTQEEMDDMNRDLDELHDMAEILS
jgi:hypothetical protein